MFYYLKIWVAIVKSGVNPAILGRADFWSKLLRAFFVVFTQWAIVYFLYLDTDQIAGLSSNQFILLLGFYNLINYLGWGIFNVNLWRLEERVLKGEYDYHMLSPAGSMFISSFREFYLDDVITSLSGLGMVLYYLLAEWGSWSLQSLFVGALLMILALVIWYALHLFVASITLWKVETGFIDLLKGITRIGAFPSDIYPQYIQLAIYTFFPVAFIANVPLMAFISSNGLSLLLAALLVASVAIAIAITMWGLMAARYSSAGG